jgi:hypothetical protein
MVMIISSIKTTNKIKMTITIRCIRKAQNKKIIQMKMKSTTNKKGRLRTKY